MPSDMRSQITRIQELLQAFNIPIVTYPNYEADDVLVHWPAKRQPRKPMS